MKISGTIRDEFGRPIYGVHVRMKLFNSIGTYTDSNGFFEKDSPAITQNDEILITHIGYDPISFLAKNLVNKSIEMQESINELNEVIVTANNSNQNSNSNSNSINGQNLNTKPGNFVNDNNANQPISKTKLFLAIAGGITLLTVGFILIKKNI